MVGFLLSLTSPGGAGGRLSVLVLHRVLARADAMVPEGIDAARFTEMCRWLQSMFTVMPLDKAIRRLRRGALPARALAITFDDGYADNHDVAMPILQGFGMSATVFVTTGYLDGGCMWNDIVIESFRGSRYPAVNLRGLLPDGAASVFKLDKPMQRREAAESVISAVKYLDPKLRLNTVRLIAEHLDVELPTNLMLRSEQVVALRDGGMQIGAHTVTHPILSKLAPDVALREMRDSKRFLEKLLGERVGLFAYPNGKHGEDFDDSTVALVREAGFDAAVTTARGAASTSTDPFLVPRFTPWDRSKFRFGMRMAATLWASRPRSAPQLSTQS